MARKRQTYLDGHTVVIDGEIGDVVVTVKCPHHDCAKRLKRAEEAFEKYRTATGEVIRLLHMTPTTPRETA